MANVGLSAAEVAAVEAVERNAWLDMYAAAPADVAAALGLQHCALDDGALLISSRLDNLQFNRLAALGTSAPVRQETFDAAVSAFDGAGVRNWVVHVAEGAASLQELCRRRGLVPHRRTWAKFVRGPDSPQAHTGLAIREVGGEDAAAFGAVAAQAFGLPPVTGRWLCAVAGRPRWLCFLAYDGRCRWLRPSSKAKPPGSAWRARSPPTADAGPSRRCWLRASQRQLARAARS